MSNRPNYPVCNDCNKPTRIGPVKYRCQCEKEKAVSEQETLQSLLASKDAEIEGLKRDLNDFIECGTLGAKMRANLIMELEQRLKDAEEIARLAFKITNDVNPPCAVYERDYEDLCFKTEEYFAKYGKEE